MKLFLQVAAGVFAALLLFAGFERYQAQRDLEDSIQAFQRSVASMGPDPLGLQAMSDRQRVEQKAVLERQSSGQAVRKAALHLRAGEACVSASSGQPGTIIVRGFSGGVPSATQLLENGRPVACLGEYRLR